MPPPFLRLAQVSTGSFSRAQAGPADLKAITVCDKRCETRQGANLGGGEASSAMHESGWNRQEQRVEKGMAIVRLQCSEKNANEKTNHE